MVREAHLVLACCLAVTACGLEDLSSPASEIVAEPLDWSSMPRSSREGPEGPPISLVSPDGVELRLTTLDVRAVLEGPLALTELHLTFHNPEDRVIEGEFEIVLPESAAVSRLAMRVDDQWQEGEVVDERRARATYERILHVPKDPLLFERRAANRFTARVFPIPARGDKQIIVAYSHALAGTDEPYRVALAGLPELTRLRVSVLERGAGRRARDRDKRFGLERMAFVPDRDLMVPRSEGAPAALRAGPYALARLRVPGEAGRDPFVGRERVDVLFDTSASLASELELALVRLGGLMASLGEGADPRVRVIAFDQGAQSVEFVYEGRASDFGADELGRLLERGSAGATDLAGALYRLVTEEPAERVVLMSDGRASVGERTTAGLAVALERLLDAGVRRVDVIALGRAHDEATLEALAGGGLVIEGSREGAGLVVELEQQPAAPADVEVLGADWSWPAALASARPGDELLVYAQLDEALPLRIRVGEGRAEKLETFAATPALLRRAHAGARIEALSRELDGGGAEVRDALVDRIVALSTEFRVLSRFTSMIVLETEQDYERFGIERDALIDILTVTDTGVGLLQRGPDDGWRPGPSPALAEGNARVLGGALDFGGSLSPASAEPPPDPPPESRRDADQDGLPDEVDACPNESEDFDGDDDDDGCPDLRAKLAPDAILIDDKVYFAYDSATIDSRSHALLDDVATLLKANPGLGKVEVGAHTDSQGRDGYNEQLSHRRAEAVVEYLLSRGVSAERLVAVGYGETRPIDTNRTKEGRTHNRRVEFLLMEPGGGDARSWRSRRAGAFGPPHQGTYAELQARLAAGAIDEALALAEDLRAEERGQARAWTLSAIALGQVHIARGELEDAARAIGSIIDTHPEDAEQLRVAAAWLEHIDALSQRSGAAFGARAIAIDALRRAVEARPDHPTGHHHLAMALLRAGSEEEAFAAAEAGLGASLPEYRDAAVELLRADLGLIAAAWVRAEPGRRAEIEDRARRQGASLANAPSLHFVLTWESDTTDADVFVESPSKLSWCSTPDVADGYGPECMVATGSKLGYPFEIRVHYARQRTMGQLFGRVQIIEHDGRGRVRFDDRPFVIQAENGLLDLGTVDGPLGEPP